jgi:uncharacterized membrane protein
MSRVEHEIIVDAPADEVYRAWRDFESFPIFMHNVEHVREIGYGRSHWRSKGPFGQRAEWDAQLIVDEPARARRSLEGAGVRTQGAVRFEDAGGATRLLVTLSYDAPMHPFGDWAARIFANPGKQVEADLLRFKTLLERGGYGGGGSAAEERSMTGGHGASGGGAAIGGASASTSVRTWEVIEEHYAVQGKYPTSTGCAEPPYGPGMSNDESVRGGPNSMDRSPAGMGIHGPTTTGTPGGTLGAPVEGELKRDQRTFSERTDTR